MADGNADSRKAECESCRPSEADMVEVPHRPNLRCKEHGRLCEEVDALHGWVRTLEERMKALEEVE